PTLPGPPIGDPAAALLATTGNTIWSGWRAALMASDPGDRPRRYSKAAPWIRFASPVLEKLMGLVHLNVSIRLRISISHVPLLNSLICLR
ncbi:unnamed protein product, partial [Urochloa humidicola]